MPNFLDERVPARIWKRLFPEPMGGCWLWAGHTNNGYGQITRVLPARGMGYAHRIVYEALVGPVGEGLHLDHKCKVRTCCNPAHLDPVTPHENNRRSDSPTALHARQTTCVNGHPLDEKNTIARRDRPGRQCRECKNERTRRYRKAA